MKKALLFTGLALLFAVGLAVSSSYADNWSWAESYATGRFNVTPTTTQKSEFLLVNSSDLIGASVKDSKGELLGLISMIEIDSQGHAFAVINHGSYEYYGEGGGFTPVPFEALQISKPELGQMTVALNMDERQLEAAPFYDPSVTDSRQYEANIYRFYGIQPYWTEGNLPNEESPSGGDMHPEF